MSIKYDGVTDNGEVKFQDTDHPQNVISCSSSQATLTYPYKNFMEIHAQLFFNNTAMVQKVIMNVGSRK